MNFKNRFAKFLSLQVKKFNSLYLFTLTDHFISYTMTVLGLTPFYLQNCLDSLWQKFNNVLKTLLRNFCPYWHDQCHAVADLLADALTPISCFTTSLKQGRMDAVSSCPILVSQCDLLSPFPNLSWQEWRHPCLVHYCCSPSASRFNIWYIQKWSFAYLILTRGYLSYCCLLSFPTNMAIILWPLVSTRHCCAENCCSLHVFTLSDHSLKTLEMVLDANPRINRFQNTQTRPPTIMPCSKWL